MGTVASSSLGNSGFSPGKTEDKGVCGLVGVYYFGYHIKEIIIIITGIEGMGGGGHHTVRAQGERRTGTATRLTPKH